MPPSPLQGVSAAALLAVLSASPLRAQQEQQVSLAGQIEIARLVDLASQRLNIAVDYDAAALKAAGTVTLRAADQLTDDELWLLVNRVLAARSMTTVRAPGASSYSVVKVADAAGLARTEPLDQDGFPAGFRTVVVRAKHRTAKDLVESVNKVIGKSQGSRSAPRPAAWFADGLVHRFDQVLGRAVSGPHHHSPEPRRRSCLRRSIGP